MGRMEPEVKGEREVEERQRKGEGHWKRGINSPGWIKDLFQVQPGQVQLSEMQIQSHLQQVFQEGPQCFELQGGQDPLGHHGLSLTRCAIKRWEPCDNRWSLQGPIHFSRQAQEEFGFIMAAQVIKTIWRDCGSRDG